MSNKIKLNACTMTIKSGDELLTKHGYVLNDDFDEEINMEIPTSLFDVHPILFLFIATIRATTVGKNILNNVQFNGSIAINDVLYTHDEVRAVMNNL